MTDVLGIGNMTANVTTSGNMTGNMSNTSSTGNVSGLMFKIGK